MENRFQNHADGQKMTERAVCRVVKASGEITGQETEIVCESEMEISVNGIPIARLRCTPTHLTELVLGRLYTERIIRSVDEVAHLFICGEGNIAEVRLTEGCTFQPYAGAEPTCCTGNQQLRERVEEDTELLQAEGTQAVYPQPEAVFTLAEHFRKDGELHRSTAGTHSCYIRFGDGRILGFEDIGRHNALDKAVGAMLLAGEDPKNCMFYTTGRVPVDMVQKAVNAGIPVLISKAVPTDAAVRLAKEHSLTLICRAWPDSYEIFTPV